MRTILTRLRKFSPVWIKLAEVKSDQFWRIPLFLFKIFRGNIFSSPWSYVIPQTGWPVCQSPILNADNMDNHHHSVFLALVIFIPDLQGSLSSLYFPKSGIHLISLYDPCDGTEKWKKENHQKCYGALRSYFDDRIFCILPNIHHRNIFHFC